MYKNFTLTGIVIPCALFFLLVQQVNAQQVFASPGNIIRPVPPQTTTVKLNRHPGLWGGSNGGNYVWSVTPSNGVVFGTYSQTGPSAGDVNVTFSSAASGTYTFTLTRESRSASVTVTVGNIAASTANGSSVSAFVLNNGTYVKGPGEVFSPSVQTAALGLSAPGYFYYLPRNFYGNRGNISIYAARPDGTGSTVIASADMNGADDNNLGFVRLAIDPIGTGWILAGDNTKLYLAKFATNGIAPTSISVVDASVTIVNGAISTFYNGDLCVSGNGTLYVLGNSNSGGTTQIFTSTPNGSNTVLTKKWDLVNENGAAFTGAANGVAFDALGSLYLSTSNGLYFINQNTVNTATGTVQCSLTKNVTGITDLGSNLYPQLTALPVKLINFNGSYHQQKTQLHWTTENEQRFNYFEVQRGDNTGNYTTIGIVFAAGNSTTSQQYMFNDDLASVNGNVFSYRLKMVDTDGRFTYSNIILVRKDAGQFKGLTISPNPAIKGSTTARYTAGTSGKYLFSIVDLSGRVLWQQQQTLVAGTNSIALSAADRLPAGTYILRVNHDELVETTRFLVIQ